MKVFISHSSKDKKFVRTLKSDLNENGIDTFVDEDSLELGDSLKERLDVALDESSHFVIILSEHSVSSDWVKYELNEALSLFDNKTLKKVIPIKYRECEIPEKLKSLIYSNLSDEIVQIENDRVKFVSDGYGKFLVQLVSALRSSDKKLNKADKKELKKEVNETEKINEKKLEEVFKIKHKIIAYKDAATIIAYQKKIAEAKKSTELAKYHPVILPPIYKTVFKNLKLGDELLFSDRVEKIVGHFAGFRTADTGLTLPPKIRKPLNIEAGATIGFIVNIDKRLFRRDSIFASLFAGVE